LMNIPNMFASLGASAIGSTRVEYGDDEGQPPQIVAKACIFPVLCQELSKGVAELLSHHGLAGMDEPTTRTVLSKADDIRHEPYLIQVGPDVWRRFNAVRPKNIPLAEIVQALAMQDDPTKIIMAVIEDPKSPETIEMLNSLVQDPEGFQDEFEDEIEGGGFDDVEEPDTSEDWKNL